MVKPEFNSSLDGRAPSIPEKQDLSRSSSNESSLASVVEENDTEATEDYDTGMVSAVVPNKNVRQAVLNWPCLICMHMFSFRRVCPLLGRHTSVTPSPTAPGWRTVWAAPVTPVAVTLQVKQSFWYIYIYVYIYIYKIKNIYKYILYLRQMWKMSPCLKGICWRRDSRLMIYWCITNACNDSWWLMHELMQAFAISCLWSPLKIIKSLSVCVVNWNIINCQ